MIVFLFRLIIFVFIARLLVRLILAVAGFFSRRYLNKHYSEHRGKAPPRKHNNDVIDAEYEKIE